MWFSQLCAFTMNCAKRNIVLRNHACPQIEQIKIMLMVKPLLKSHRSANPNKINAISVK